MGRVKIPYYVVIKGRGYWQPTAKMRAEGFAQVPCGPDGPEAWKVAITWNERWQRHRRGERVTIHAAAATDADPEAANVYPKASLGEAFGRYRRTPEWSRKAPATRDDWWRGWRRIRPVFGDVAPHTVGLEEISAWRAYLQESVGTRETHRALKIWRALWKVAAAMHYCERDADPSLGVRNSAAPGRSATWSDGEIARLAKRAWREGYRGLAAALAVQWDTQMSPGDVRALTAGQLLADTIATTRAKTGVSVRAALSRRTRAIVDAYVATLPFTPLPDQPLFRTRGYAPPPGSKGGRPRIPAPYTKNAMAADFREVRVLVFGERETRQMLDIRRSGAVEAIAGGARAEQLAHAMGNTLSASNALFETYVPASVTSLQAVAEARLKGRRKMRQKNEP
ncbi:hypothetical protein [Mongoliimonas terrestris]|uniref:hypothetical protein n=1 Tax=Mongoliimonas terrestris TaxID=1709001 RepID=UPI000B052A53|nr:hypothetical protein [Mongoliimonas terrestris]